MSNTFWDGIEQTILNRLLIGESFPDYTPVKISLHTAEPGAGGTSEVAGGSYARVQVNTDKWTHAVTIGIGSASYNVEDISFTGMPAVTITHFGVWSNDGSVFIMSAPLDAPQTITGGSTFKFLAGRIRIIQG